MIAVDFDASSTNTIRLYVCLFCDRLSHVVHDTEVRGREELAQAVREAESAIRVCSLYILNALWLERP